MSVTVPDGLPILSEGMHATPASGACVMEYVSLLSGERWGDAPKCVHFTLSAAARVTNDFLDDELRQELMPLLTRFIGTSALSLPRMSETARLEYDRLFTYLACDTDRLTNYHRNWGHARRECSICRVDGRVRLDKLERMLDLVDESLGRQLIDEVERLEGARKAERLRVESKIGKGVDGW